MKIFRRHYALRVYRTVSLPHLLSQLKSWISEVLVIGSPFLQQVSSYLIADPSGSYVSRDKKISKSAEIISTCEMEDLISCLELAIIEAYQSYDSSLGSNLINWLSWKIPYLYSKEIKLLIANEPDQHYFSDTIDSGFTHLAEQSYEQMISLLVLDELDISKQRKYYFRRKL